LFEWKAAGSQGLVVGPFPITALNQALRDPTSVNADVYCTLAMSRLSKSLRKNRPWMPCLFGLGYFGAAVFYSYLIGINAQTRIACPVCPCILSSGTPIHKFLSRVLVLGTLNGLLFVLVGWLVISSMSFIRRVASN